MFILKNLNIEAKRSKLMLKCESSEAKRICSIVEKIISKRSEPVYIEEFKYRSEANRFDSDFVFKKTKKTNFRFFFNEGQKTKGFDSKLSKFCHSYASVVHTQIDYDTTAVFVGAAGAGLELRLSVLHTQTDYGTTAVFVGAGGAGLELRLCGAHTGRLRHHSCVCRCCGCWAGTMPLLVHTQTDYDTTAVFVGAAGAGLELCLYWCTHRHSTAPQLFL
jgi:hypothetical protein